MYRCCIVYTLLKGLKQMNKKIVIECVFSNTWWQGHHKTAAILKRWKDQTALRLYNPGCIKQICAKLVTSVHQLLHDFFYRQIPSLFYNSRDFKKESGCASLLKIQRFKVN